MTNTENTTNAAVYTFAPDAITCNGRTFPAEYSINPTSGNVFAFLTIGENGGKPVTVRLKVERDEAEYPAILAAAQQEREARKAAKQEPVTVEQEQPAPVAEPVTVQQEQPATVAKREQPAALAAYWAKRRAEKQAAQEQPAAPVTVEQEQPAPVAEPVTVQQEQTAPVAEPVTVQQERDPKQARGPIPEKSFIGLEIKGNGWKILFDGDHERTRVIFKREPNAAAKAAIEKAGFYWSPVLQSWNKKLTFKAYRAAQALALDLRAVCG